MFTSSLFLKYSVSNLAASLTEGPLQMSTSITDQNHPYGENEKSRDVIRGHFIYLGQRKILHFFLLLFPFFFCIVFFPIPFIPLTPPSTSTVPNPLPPHSQPFCPSPHLPGSLSHRWSNWEDFLCERYYRSLKKRYVFVWKKITEY